jgi:hypothetical protein
MNSNLVFAGAFRHPNGGGKSMAHQLALSQTKRARVFMRPALMNLIFKQGRKLTICATCLSPAKAGSRKNKRL